MTRRGVHLRAFVAAFVDPRTMERVVDAAIADLQHEPLSLTRYLAVLKVVTFCLAETFMRIGSMRCSFCRRPESEVAKMVAGPWRLLAGRVYICDRCVTQTIRIMEGQFDDRTPCAERESIVRRVLNRVNRLRHRRFSAAQAADVA